MIVKYAFFSDLHLGDGSLADNFQKKNWKDFYSLIKKLWNEKYIIVLVGDIFELLQFKYKDIVKTYPEIVNVVSNSKYVIGNHDLEVSKYITTAEMYDKLELCNGKVLIYHGHQDDLPMGKGIVKLALRCWAFIEKLVGKKISSWIQSEPISPNDKRYIGDKSEYVKKAKERAIKLDKRIVIFGHTHEPGIFYCTNHGFFIKRVIINTGTCQNSKLMYATIEYNAYTDEIVDYTLKFIK